MEHVKVERKIPKVLMVTGLLILGLIVLYIAVVEFLVLVSFYQATVVTGLIFTFTPLGWICMVLPLYIPLMSIGWYENYSHIENSFEYWFKVIGTFIGTIAATFIAYYIGLIAALMLASAISGAKFM